MLAAVGLIGGAGCGSPSAPRLETAADSLALRFVDAGGGNAAWQALPAVRFDWIVRTDSAEMFRVKHLWDKAADRARIEWPVGEDSMLVTVLSPNLFAPDAPSGVAALTVGDAAPEILSGDAALDALRDGHARWVNDTYWMVAPFKVFDPGVTRALAPDSGATTLALSFGDVGLTPGDRYWLRLGADGSVAGWTYLLEGDTTATRWTWSDRREIGDPDAPVAVWAVKSKDGAPLQIVTEPMPMPADDVLEDLAPVL